MKICIVGAGAVGGLIGTRLAAHGRSEVSALARGETLQALNAHGWRVKQGEALLNGPARAVGDGARAWAAGSRGDRGQGAGHDGSGGRDRPAARARDDRHAGDERRAMVVRAGFGAARGKSLESVDPGGAIARAIPLRHVVGCVVHLSAATAEPGLVVHRQGAGLIIGEPDGAMSPRLKGLHDLLTEARFDVTSSPTIRHDIWYKLWGNLTMNPVSALTGATGDRMLDDPLVRTFCSAAMLEASEIGARIGCTIDQDPEARHAVTRELGAFKTSMLVDAERGKPIELDAIVTVVHELGRRTGVATPNIDALLGLTRLFAQSRGLLVG